MDMSNVADIKTDGVEVILSGQQHVIKFDLNAFAELEEKFGTIDKAMEVLQNGSIKGIRMLLLYGLLHEDENLTERQVGAMVGINDLQALTVAITKSLGESLPPQEAAQEIESAQVGNTEPSR
jgi:hypothetical protein